MKTRFIIILVALLAISCTSREEKEKRAEEKGNKLVSKKASLIKGAGEALKKEGKEAVEYASEGVGEIIKGANSGIEKSFTDANIEVDSTFNLQFEIGRAEKRYSDSEDGKKVIIYLIARQTYNGELRLKAYDSGGKEIGRSVANIALEEEDAGYFDFDFDDRTPLLQVEKFVLETK